MLIYAGYMCVDVSSIILHSGANQKGGNGAVSWQSLGICIIYFLNLVLDSCLNIFVAMNRIADGALDAKLPWCSTEFCSEFNGATSGPQNWNIKLNLYLTVQTLLEFPWYAFPASCSFEGRLQSPGSPKVLAAVPRTRRALQLTNLSASATHRTA